ncbi:MAG: hypothetical protein MHPSP_004322, partial [Paramarteilia canceri]
MLAGNCEICRTKVDDLANHFSSEWHELNVKLILDQKVSSFDHEFEPLNYAEFCDYSERLRKEKENY